MMRIAFFETEPWEEEYLERKLPGHELSFSRAPLSGAPESGSDFAEVLSPFIYSRIDATVLGAFPRLKLVATRSTGVDHIAIEACTSRGIDVSNVPSYGENTVAEHTFALLLTLSRRLYRACLERLEGDFSIRDLTGVDLKDKTIGVIGTGRIGLHVIRIARGFGMKVLAYDVSPHDILAEVLGFNYVPLEDLLARSDVVSLHVPYIPATHHLLDRRKFALMKKGAYLINTARGGVVDQEALLAALDDGTLGGAGLDVLEGEEYITEEKAVLTDENRADVLGAVGQNALILRHKNVVYTPHIGFNSREALIRILDTTVDNIVGFSAGEPQNLVNPEVRKRPD
jgi:D-lactate dehydrogenase